LLGTTVILSEMIVSSSRFKKLTLYIHDYMHLWKGPLLSGTDAQYFLTCVRPPPSRTPLEGKDCILANNVTFILDFTSSFSFSLQSLRLLSVLKKHLGVVCPCPCSICEVATRLSSREYNASESSPVENYN
jgi:hypothetical protein